MADEARYGMSTPDGDAAVHVLVSRVVAGFEDGFDYDRAAADLNEGTALIASLHPEVLHPAVIMIINDQVAQAIAARYGTP